MGEQKINGQADDGLEPGSPNRGNPMPQLTDRIKADIMSYIPRKEEHKKGVRLSIIQSKVSFLGESWQSHWGSQRDFLEKSLEELEVEEINGKKRYWLHAVTIPNGDAAPSKQTKEDIGEHTDKHE